MKSKPGAPMTLSNGAKAELRLIVWYRCTRALRPDIAGLALERFLSA
jgi:hypothetical protein